MVNEGMCISCGKTLTGRQTMYCSLKCKRKFRARRYRMKIKAKIVEYFGGKCSSCGYDKCMDALEVHHLDPDIKECSMKQIYSMSWKRILLELKKCIMLCSNCHKEEHYKIRGGEVV